MVSCDFSKKNKLPTNYTIPVADAGDSDQEEDDEVGGMFKVARQKNMREKVNRVTANATDCSRFHIADIRDWLEEEVGVGLSTTIKIYCVSSLLII